MMVWCPIHLLELIKNNTQTITGRNIRLILNELNERSIQDMKNKIKLKVIPQNEIWKVDMIKELTEVKQNKLFITDDKKGNQYDYC